MNPRPESLGKTDSVVKVVVAARLNEPEARKPRQVKSSSNPSRNSKVSMNPRPESLGKPYQEYTVYEHHSLNEPEARKPRQVIDPGKALPPIVSQ